LTVFVDGNSGVPLTPAEIKEITDALKEIYGIEGGDVVVNIITTKFSEDSSCPPCPITKAVKESEPTPSSVDPIIETVSTIEEITDVLKQIEE